MDLELLKPLLLVELFLNPDEPFLIILDLFFIYHFLLRRSTSGYPGSSGGTSVYTGTGSSASANATSYKDITGLSANTTYYFTCTSVASPLPNGSSYNVSAKTLEDGIAVFTAGNPLGFVYANTAGSVYSDRLHTEEGSMGTGALYGNYEYATFIALNLPFSKIQGIEECTRVRTKLNAYGYNLNNYVNGGLSISIYNYGQRSSLASANIVPYRPGVVSSTTEFTTDITKFSSQGGWDRFSESNVTITISAYRSYTTSGGELYRINFEDLDIYEIKFLK